MARGVSRPPARSAPRALSPCCTRTTRTSSRGRAGESSRFRFEGAARFQWAPRQRHRAYRRSRAAPPDWIRVKTSHGTRLASGIRGRLKDGKVDAFFWSGGLPTAAVQDPAATPGISITLSLPSDDVLPHCGATTGLLFSLEIPAGAYRRVDHAGLGRRRGQRPRRQPLDARAIWPTTSRGCCSRRRPTSPRSIPKPRTCRSSAGRPARPPSIIPARSSNPAHEERQQ